MKSALAVIVVVVTLVAFGFKHSVSAAADPAAVPGTDQPPGELLSNRSFELNRTGRGFADGWGGNSYGTDAVLALDDQVSRSGRHSIRIDGVLRSRAGIQASFGAEDTDPAAVYLLSAWVKIEGTSSHPLRTSARITSVDAGGTVLDSDYRLCPPGPCDWTYCEWLVTLPPQSHRFNVVFFHHGEGTVWWDDISLRKARPVQVLAPPKDATVSDARPTFRWQSVPGNAVLEVAAGDSFAPEQTRRFEVTGDRFEVPDALPEAQDYLWRVMTTEPDGDVTVAVARDDAADTWEPARFFAGTWQQRMSGLGETLTPYRELLPKVQSFAQRHNMWDAFSLLENALAQGDTLASEEPSDPGRARAELDETLAELAYTVPWWEKIFLDDAAFFAGLDLDRSELEAVRIAVADADWPAARQALLDYFRQRSEPDYYGRHRTAPVRNPAVTTNPGADKLLEHKFAIHSYHEPEYDMGPTFNWYANPIVDREWPTRIHRHFHWGRIAGAYWQTGNEKYATEIVQQLFDWAKDNPMERWQPDRGRIAWSTLNTTIRIYSSWLNTWYRVKDSEAWNADAQFVFLTSLREHGRFLMRHAARHGNWVVAEARGLVELGVMFPEFEEAAAWRDEGYRRLRRELEEQVLSDGVHVERTPGYHGMTLGCFLEPVRLGLLNNVEVVGRERFIEKLEKMHEFYLYGVKPDGRMEQVGSSGMTAVAGPLRRGWDMFRREDMLWVATGGAEGRAPIYRSYAFDGAGFYVSRSAWNDPEALWSILNWRTGFVGHCHEDMGHLSIVAYGANLLIDSGTYSYARPMRLPFLQTVGHNTVLVNRTTQKRRGALSGHWVSAAPFDFFHGAQDNSEPLIHERTLLFRQPDAAGPGYWLVLDRLDGEGSHRLDQRWHPTEKLSGRAVDSSVIYTPKAEEGPHPALVVANLPQPGLNTEVVEGAISYRWYTKIPVDVAQFTLDGPVPAEFATVLYPTPPGLEPARISLERVAPEPGTSVAEAVVLRAVIEDNGRTFHDLWLINPRGEGNIVAGSVETDARAVLLRLENERQSWFAVEGSVLRHAGNTLFEADANVAGAGAVLAPGTASLSCTAATGVRFHAPGETTLNGTPVETGKQGDILLVMTVPEQPVPEVPRAPGEPRFEIDSSSPVPQASAFLRLLPPEDAGIPKNAILIEAEEYSAQGGGAVQVTDAKVGAHGTSFLHWDRAGHWLEWRAELAAAQRCRLLIRACTAEALVLRKLTVNDRTPAAAAAMEFAGTGGYSNHNDDWRTFLVLDAHGEALVLDLPAGETVIRLENIDGRSLNLDWLALQPVD